jgi:hypothetical protein
MCSGGFERRDVSGANSAASPGGVHACQTNVRHLLHNIVMVLRAGEVYMVSHDGFQSGIWDVYGESNGWLP